MMAPLHTHRMVVVGAMSKELLRTKPACIASILNCNGDEKPLVVAKDLKTVFDSGLEGATALLRYDAVRHLGLVQNLEAARITIRQADEITQLKCLGRISLLAVQLGRDSALTVAKLYRMCMWFRN
jgi:hypothetical protein